MNKRDQRIYNEQREEEKRVLADEINALHEEMAATLHNFSNTVEPELLEYYTYYYKASQLKHSYLMRQLKKIYYDETNSHVI